MPFKPPCDRRKSSPGPPERADFFEDCMHLNAVYDFFWGRRTKILRALMRFAGGDVRGPFYPKSITDLRRGAEKRQSSKEDQRSTFARFLKQGLAEFG